jgi:hypothetical protein
VEAEIGHAPVLAFLLPALAEQLRQPRDVMAMRRLVGCQHMPLRGIASDGRFNLMSVI